MIRLPISIRYAVLSLALAIVSAPNEVSACSCMSEPQTISNFMLDHIVFWGIAQNSTLVETQSPYPERLTPIRIVVTRIKIVEDYGQYLPSEITIEAAPQLGGNCGASPSIGALEFWAAWRSEDGTFRTSTCTSVPSFKLVLDYLRTGRDALVDPRIDCDIITADADPLLTQSEDMRVCEAMGEEWTLSNKERRRLYDEMRARELP